MATPATTTETSVMMSLRELRTIEDARRADEAIEREREIADAAREAAAREATVRAAEAAAIAAREASAQRAREIEELTAREAELRVREREALARAAAEAVLAARRLDEEMELRRAQVARTRPKAMLALLGVCAAAALGLGALYMSRSSDVDRLDDTIAKAKAENAAQQLRIGGLESARVGTEHLIDGLRTQLLAINRALIAEIPRGTGGTGGTAVGPPQRPHGHHGGPTTAPPPQPPGSTGTINLGDCAREPLLCNK